MHMHKTTLHIFIFVALWCVALALLGTLPACSGAPTQPSATTVSGPSVPTEKALITLNVSLPAPLPPGDSIYVAVLDEVTGLSFNVEKFVMQAEDATHYTVSIPFPLGSVVNYRYIRGGSSLAQEHTTDGRAVRYRLMHIEGPGTYEDVVARWTDTQYNGPTGRITGQIIDASTSQPIPNILIGAGGFHALTAADGTYLIEGIPPGTHNLVAYSLNGAYQVFQQGALVAANSSTPAMASLTPAQMVALTFYVTAPSNTPPRSALRLAGNLSQLGNTFADLSGGVSTIASRMPILSLQADGKYAVTIILPAGADIRYKYTLGDGLWNAEYTLTGALRLRQIIVPEEDTQIMDTIDTWQTPGQEPLSFQVSVPNTTPDDEIISIQFNPGYGWLEPIPMWVSGTDRFTWQYTLFNPLQSITTLSYRYCRQEQCGRADDQATAGYHASGQVVTLTEQPTAIQDTVTQWMWLPASPSPAVVPNLVIRPRSPEFVAGIALSPDYHPSWSNHLPEAISSINSLNPNLLLFSPTWTFTRQNLPVFELSPSQDIQWSDLSSSIAQAKALGLNVGIFPSPHFPSSSAEWWQTASRDFSWWVTWYDRYRSFATHHASLATSTGAQVLVLGGEWLEPALPGGRLADGSASNAPEDAEVRWRSIIQDVRARYNGTLAWALPYRDLQNPPPFLDLFDQIYILWDTVSLASSPSLNEVEMQAAALQLLDEQVQPLQQQAGKPIILAVTYASATGTVTGCPQSASGACIEIDPYLHQGLDWVGETVNLEEQVSAYNAIFMAINERDWISGFVSMGFYPPAGLQDPSASVNGKPASGTLWFWFPALLQSP